MFVKVFFKKCWSITIMMYANCIATICIAVCNRDHLRSTTRQGRRRSLENVKSNVNFKYLKEVTVNWLSYLIFQACFMTFKMIQFCWNDCSDWAEVNVKEQLSPLASLRRPEDVKMLTEMLTLFTERGQRWEYSWDYKLFILFVSHE